MVMNGEGKGELNRIRDGALDRSMKELREGVGMGEVRVNVGFRDGKWGEWG